MSQREEDIVRRNSHISNYTSQLPTPRALNLINFLNWHLGMTICFFWRKKWFKEELQHMLILVFRPGRAACGILVPHPGTEPSLWQWERRVLTTEPPGNSPVLIFKRKKICLCGRIYPFVSLSQVTIFKVGFIKAGLWRTGDRTRFNFILPSPDPLFTFQVCLLFLKSFACR